MARIFGDNLWLGVNFPRHEKKSDQTSEHYKKYRKDGYNQEKSPKAHINRIISIGK
ncbi:MAG: DNA polymerase IIIc chi subunit [Saprospiraceae bacterium]|jgi:DNA polymerase IIIc chi subunit|tara:strand:- start:2993 stop:3160 length:168 start_codon:yes stop_codon:yes gene_type:complete